MTCEDPLVDGWVGVEVQGGGGSLNGPFVVLRRYYQTP